MYVLYMMDCLTFDGVVPEFLQRVWPIYQDVLRGELCTLTRGVFYKLQVERVPYD